MDFDALAFGQRLREERERLGLTQVASADKCGVRREMWGKYERGAAEPGVRVAARMGELGADVLYLLLGRREPTLSEGEGLVRPIELGLLVVQVKRAFDRQCISPADFDLEDGNAERRYWARIVILAAEIYNTIRTVEGGESSDELRQQLALGAAMGERSRFRP